MSRRRPFPFPKYFIDVILCKKHLPDGEPPHGVVGEVHDLERDVAGGEDLGGQLLPARALLAELLDVVAQRQHGEVAREYDVVAVDARGVDLVEAAEAGHADGRAELHARDLDGGHLGLGAGGPGGRQQQQQRGQERPRAVVAEGLHGGRGF